MIALNTAFLDSCGLDGLPANTKRSLLSATYDELELRVGEAISSSLSAAEVDEFEQLVDEDPDRSSAWLEAHVPHYRTIVGQKVEEITRELALKAPMILARFAAA